MMAKSSRKLTSYFPFLNWLSQIISHTLKANFCVGLTTALSVIVFIIINQFVELGTSLYIQLCFILILWAGVVQQLFGLLRFGAVVNFVSYSVVQSFTYGINLSGNELALVNEVNSGYLSLYSM